MGSSRRGERQPGKSDQIDALAIARAVLREGLERFPLAVLEEPELEIRLLADHRDQLVAERTRAQNRLRWHLVALDPTLEASLPPRPLDRPKHLDRVTHQLARLPTSSARVRLARQLVTHIRSLTDQANSLERELRARVRAQRAELLTETGSAPIPASSGNRHRHRLHRGGQPPTQPRAAHHRPHPRSPRPQTHAYLARKLAEGKTQNAAIRCLKRHLARRFYRLLTQPATPPPTPDPTTLNSPIPIPCLTEQRPVEGRLGGAES